MKKLAASPYQSYLSVQHWMALKKIIPPQQIVSSHQQLFPVFKNVYDYVYRFYERLPLRKNGEVSFIHPLNVTYFLKLSSDGPYFKDHSTTDNPESTLIFIAGMLHDVLEENIDLTGKSYRQASADLSQFLYHCLEEKSGLEKENCLEKEDVISIMTMVGLLTKQENSYYHYISKIFNCPDELVKESVIKIKLADRMHNILCIDCFNEQERIYECFKNLFLLNNTKKFLIDHYGAGMFNGVVNNQTEMLFNKCLKATYDAFIKIYQTAANRGAEEVSSLLQLAFKKFAFLYDGLDSVTDITQEPHLLRLHLGIIRKYDFLLHREIKKYLHYQQDELAFCADFFRDYHFNKDQLRSILDYKDAYFLKEVLAKLLYKPDYFMSLFVTSELSKEGRLR